VTCTLTLNNVTLLKLVRTKGNVEIVCNCEMGYLTHVKIIILIPDARLNLFVAVQCNIHYAI
jgi:hypothetical protein